MAYHIAQTALSHRAGNQWSSRRAVGWGRQSGGGHSRTDFGAGGGKEASSLPPRPRLLRSVERMRKWVHAVTAPTCSMPGDLMNVDARHHANRDGRIGDTIYGSGSTAPRLRAAGAFT